MPTFSLAKPFENAEGADEETVLALIDHLMPTLEDWRLGEDLRSEDHLLSERLVATGSELKAHIAEFEKSAIEIEANLALLKKMKAIAIAVAAVGLLLAIFFSVAVVIVLGAVYPFMKMRGLKKTLDEALQHRSNLEKEIANLKSSEDADVQRQAEIAKELGQRADGFPEVVMSRVSFNLQAAHIAGENVLVDLSDSHHSSDLRTIDVSKLSDEIESIGNRVQGLSSVPPLLSPADANQIDDPINHLYGEEHNLQDLVGEFTVGLGRLEDIKVSIPLVDKNSILVQRLQSGELNALDEAPGISIENSKGLEEIRSFLEVFNQNKQESQEVIDKLVQVYGELESCCRRFATARVNSINLIHQNLTDVLTRSTWVNRKFFCPRTIIAPQYIQDLIGVNVDSAHLLNINDLLDHLQRDDSIRERIAKKPELIEQLTNAYNSVYDFMGDVAIDEDGQVLQQSERPRHLTLQYEESVKQFRMILNRVLTGASYPILNFSSQAQLFYDPELDEWTSDMNPYVYSTPDVLKYGSVIKAHFDLMIPLWEHLWTEKADFRKSELFRTNESMISMSEKESEKLIEIGNQFRGDMRTNRENIYLLESELSSKFNEILSFRDGMHQLGLLSDRAMAQLKDENLKKLVSDDSPLEMSQRYETTLSALPQSQAEVRGTVVDPIDMVRDPSALISFSAGNASARLISHS